MSPPGAASGQYPARVDQSQTQSYAYPSPAAYAGYAPYATSCVDSAYMTAAAKARASPYSRPTMDYPTYHPRVSGLYSHNFGYGYDNR